MHIKCLVLISSALFTILSVGCGTKSIRVSSYKPHTDNKGVAYFLPKTVLKLTITYTVREKRAYMYGSVVSQNNPSVFIQKPIIVEPALIADKRKTLIISGKSISQDVFLESTLDFKLGDNGLLQSVDADIKDKTLETVQQIVTTGIRFAKIITPKGETPERWYDLPEYSSIKPMLDRIRKVYMEIDTVLIKKKPNYDKKLQALQNELSILNNLVESFLQKNKVVYHDTDIVHTYTLDPENCLEETGQGGFYSETIEADNLIGGEPGRTRPKVKVSFKINKSDFENAKDLFEKTDEKAGIIYRPTTPILTTIKVINGEQVVPVYSGFINLPQFGQLVYAPIESKKLTTRKTIVSLSPNSGGLTQYRIESGGTAEAAAKQLSSTFEDLQKAILDIRYNLKTQDLENQKKLVEAEKNLLDAQKALEESKKALEDAKKSKTDTLKTETP